MIGVNVLARSCEPVMKLFAKNPSVHTHHIIRNGRMGTTQMMVLLMILTRDRSIWTGEL